MLGRRRPRSSDTHSPHEPTPHNDTFTFAFLESASFELEHGMFLVIAYAFQGNMTDPTCLSGKAQEVKPAAARPPKGAKHLPGSPSDSTDLEQREPLATTFACLFCNHENSVVVKLDKKLGLGDLSCKVCGQKFQTGINCGWKRS